MSKIALTPGCPAGIGPEIFRKAIARARKESWFGDDVEFIWCGSQALLGMHDIDCVLRDNEDEGLKAVPGVVSDAALQAQKLYLLKAIELARSGTVHAIVTGPVRKAALSDVDGRDFPGQTELLHHYLAADDKAPLMCFAGGPFLLGLATVHVPVRDVAERITKRLVVEKCERLVEAVKELGEIPLIPPRVPFRVLGKGDATPLPTPSFPNTLKGTRGGPGRISLPSSFSSFSLPPHSPHIIILGLNPHAGENGRLGHEEVDIILPAITELRKRGMNIEGPLPADGFFASLHRRQVMPDAVLAMMHDQGLAPYKLLGNHVANVTIGLKVLRTSPAHGTADDIAGKGVASEESLVEAIRIAVVTKKKKGEEKSSPALL